MIDSQIVLHVEHLEWRSRESMDLNETAFVPDYLTQRFFNSVCLRSVESSRICQRDGRMACERVDEKVEIRKNARVLLPDLTSAFFRKFKLKGPVNFLILNRPTL